MTAALYLPRERLQDLLDTLRQANYRCVGPQLRDGAIVYDSLQHVEQLPIGVHDRQSPGSYRIESDTTRHCFAWANGPQALKPLLFTPREVLWRVQRDAQGHLKFVTESSHAEPLAVIGVRACDLAALQLLDQHFLRPDQPDSRYAARRATLFLIAVNCSHPAETCFCVSTGDGPVVDGGHDIVLTELDEGFVAQAGSEAGQAVLDELCLAVADAPQLHAALQQGVSAAEMQTRRFPGRDLQDALFANLQHPRWQQVAERCLSCGNCTAVCPTCFCHRSYEQPRLDAQASEHGREWDSCFTEGHSYITGHTVRPDTRLRYRQWLTHKLGSWHEQYGRSGCVGCGRCITWCPTGIDITEEAAAICT
ncbi:MAG: Anaerobic sulfite reductase subunit [Proteobacteria bacterium]|nr:Anaerobic sulfite reductase subunit [Pseudomonadota bacterium]